MEPLQDAGRAANPFDQERLERDQRLPRPEGRERPAEGRRSPSRKVTTSPRIVAVQEYQDLQRDHELRHRRSATCQAQVLQYGSQNFQQTVEINRASAEGIRVGMAVASSAGLVGRITQVFSAHRSVVMLDRPTRSSRWRSRSSAPRASSCRVAATTPPPRRPRRRPSRRRPPLDPGLIEWRLPPDFSLGLRRPGHRRRDHHDDDRTDDHGTCDHHDRRPRRGSRSENSGSSSGAARAAHRWWACSPTTGAA